MWFDRRLLLNAAVYYIDWKDIQVQGRSETGGVPITVNGGTAASKGIELTTRWSITDYLELAANVTFNDSKLTEDSAHLVDGEAAFDGDRLAGTPKQQGTLLLAYTRPLDSGYTFTADYSIAGGQRRVHEGRPAQQRRGTAGLGRARPRVRPGARSLVGAAVRGQPVRQVCR